MYARTYGVSLSGMDGYVVTVEVDITPGLPSFDIVGLPTTSVREAKERVRSAIKNGGFDFPMKRIVVNLAPAHIRKDGSSLDLAIAVGILKAQKNKSYTKTTKNDEEILLIGELSLDGNLQPVQGMLPMVMALESHKEDNITSFTHIIVPTWNRLEAKAGSTRCIWGIESLRQVMDVLQNPSAHVEEDVFEPEVTHHRPLLLEDVKGQIMGKRALMIAAAGGHHVLMSGPPGSGKTMLAKRLSSLLPPLSREEQLEVSRIYSVMGLLKEGRLIRERPFRSPHHTSTLVAMVGGGHYPKPGEITLAHKGVLFLDEAPEFRRPVIEVLRQPLEERIVHLSRVGTAITYPSDCLVIMAMNPCPCGWHGTEEDHRCNCTPIQIQRYRRALSGPILDRIDLLVPVERPTLDEVRSTYEGPSTEELKSSIVKARAIQRERFKEDSIEVNAQMTRKDIERYCKLTEEAQNLLDGAFHSLHLSLRSYDRTIKVARTISDLEEKEYIEAAHIAEALSFRQMNEEGH